MEEEWQSAVRGREWKHPPVQGGSAGSGLSGLLQLGRRLGCEKSPGTLLCFLRESEESLSAPSSPLGLAVAATSQAANRTQHTQCDGDSQVGDKGELPAAFPQ